MLLCCHYQYRKWWMRMKKDKNHKMEAVEQFKFDFEKSLIQPCEKVSFCRFYWSWNCSYTICFVLIWCILFDGVLMYIDLYAGHQTWRFTHASITEKYVDIHFCERLKGDKKTKLESLLSPIILKCITRGYHYEYVMNDIFWPFTCINNLNCWCRRFNDL